jgi:uncharacterized HAD superfamily protein
LRHSNIICDLDGTIALDKKRNHFLHAKDCPKLCTSGLARPDNYSCTCKSEERDWKSYFEACDTDEPCRAVIEILHKFMIYHNIWILSGRSAEVTDKTLVWLEKHNVPYHYLQMRPIGDRTDDHFLKIGWAKTFDLHPDNTLFVLEDRTRVVNAWRESGFRCFQVAESNF